MKPLLLILFTILIISCKERPSYDTVKSPDAPLVLNGREDSIGIERHWLKIEDPIQKIKVSVFIHIPVINDTSALTSVLPVVQWKKAHFESARKKIGDAPAKKITESLFYASVKGKYVEKKVAVLIFGPGLGWLGSDYYNILLKVAKEGIIVVTMSFSPISDVVQFPDEVNLINERPEVDYKKASAALSFVTSKMLSLSKDPESVLYRRIDSTRVVVGGHSVSGASTFSAAAENPNIKGIINLDGDVTEEMSEVAPTQPILYITSQPHTVSDSDPKTWSNDKSELRRDTYFLRNRRQSAFSIRMKIPNMLHSDFLDASSIKNEIDKSYWEKRFGKIDASASSLMVSEAVTTFILNKSWDAFKEKYTNVVIE